MSDLPVRATPDREYLGAIVDLLAEQNGILGEIRDNLTPQQPVAADDKPTRIELREPVGTPPARAGRGASTALWVEYAETNGVTIPADATRADIIAACQAAGIRT